MGYEIYEFREGNTELCGWKMAKSAISGQNPNISTGTRCVERKWYQYQKKGYQYPFTSRGLIPVPIKVVPVPMLPTTLFVYPLYC